jgi:hypothetical protein
MTNIETYGSVMKEIKLRTEVITHFLSGQSKTKYTPTTVETVGLQFRKIFELIVFASLAANRDQYSRVYADFARHWNAAKLVKNLRKINPEFYPKPVIEIPSDRRGIGRELRNREPDYLSQAELVLAHGKCGTLLHAANPFAKPIDYVSYQKNCTEWLSKLINLLNSHEVHLPGDPGFWLVHMLENEKGDEVSWYRFDPPAHLKTN